VTDPIQEADAGGLAALADILSLNRLLALSTVSPEGEAHINTAFFAFDERFTVYLLSPPGSEHARHLLANPSAAASIYDSRQSKDERRGVQLFGRMSQLEGEAADRALTCFGARFDDIAGAASSADELFDRRGLKFFGLVPERAKVFDELRLRHGDYVEFELSRGQTRSS